MIFWIDLFGTVPHPYNPDLHLQIKGNATQRSNVSMLNAAKLAFNSLRAIRAEFNMHPWLPQAVPTNGQRKAPQAATSKQQEPVGEPVGEQTPAGRTRQQAPAEQAATGRTRSDPQPSETKTEQPIGNEEWFEVKKLTLTWDLGNTFKLVRVKCGRWVKHGVPAYLDSSNMPIDVVKMIEKGQWTTDQPPIEGSELANNFRDMQYVLVTKDADGKNVKAVGFKESL